MPDRLSRERGSERTLVVATGHDLSLALLEGDGLLAEQSLPMTRGHAEAVVPAIAALLAPFGGAGSDIGRIVVETGPGSFTGLRVGLAAARALALAWGASLRGVRSTQLVAAAVRGAGCMEPMLVALAAPRGQIWVEGFGAGGLESLGPAEALDQALFRQRAERFGLVAGTVAAELPGSLSVPPRAAEVAGLARQQLGEAELLYVRAADSAAA